MSADPRAWDEVDALAVNTIRTLAIDAIQKANSGHPGTPMALAPVAYVLWQRFLRFDPEDPIWPNRDRFVLSVGHASMLLYALLHLSQVRAVDPDYETLGNPSVSLDDIKCFRQLDYLCWVYDNNHISIDGRTEITYEDDVAARFMGYGWNVTRVGDANDMGLLTRAFETFQAEEHRPTLIIVDSHIGWGSPKQDTAAVHGEPLGEEDVRATKRAYGWPEDAQFLGPE